METGRITAGLGGSPIARVERGTSFGDGSSASATRDPSFHSVLHRTRGEQDPKLVARRAAEEFVAQTLVLPILKSVREQNQAAPPFAPGDYEKTIGGLFDLEIATRMVRSQRFPIVDAVARDLLREGRGWPPRAGDVEQGGSNDDPISVEAGIESGEARRPSASD